MSFFGFEQQTDLENEKRKFLEGGLSGASQDDVAVFTWGEDSYDGLGDALQEGGDELNDETFGISGPVGKDFDFSGTSLPEHEKPAPSEHAQASQASQQVQQSSQSAQRTHASHLDAVWSNKSPFSVLPRSSGPFRTHDHLGDSASKSSLLAPGTSQSTSAHKPASLSLGADLHQGVHTLEEIEREMLAAAAAQHQQQLQQRQREEEEQLRLQQAQQQLEQLQLQQQLLHQQQSQAQMPAHGLLQSPSRTHAPPRQVPGPQHAAATPPPRMHPHSQSPRFHQQQQQHQIHLLQMQQQQQQRQLLELQEQRERQQQRQLLELQEQLRLEEMERQQQQHRLQQQQMNAGVNELMQSHLIHQRLNSGGLSPAFDSRARRVGRQSPLMTPPIQVDVPFAQNMQYLPQNIQMQQRLLAEMAQAEFLNTLQSAGLPERETRESREVQEILRVEAMRKIMEAERMEEKRKRRLDKIAHMSRYNDLMTQSDKDFITRIQVSQLVTQDPYADDFYAQVYGAILRSRMGLPTSEDRVLKFGSGGGVGLGLGQKVPGRRQSAMQRMEAQVERIVNNARLREKEKSSLNNLQGALGRTAGRSYKAAPRQLLQVDSNNVSTSPAVSHASAAHISKSDAARAQEEGEGAAREAAKIGREALRNTADSTGLVHRDPLTHREALVKLEQLYDLVLDLEQRRRDQPNPEDIEDFEQWTQECSTLIDQLFDQLLVSVPLEISTPHPFISLITPIKGKKLLPRVARLLDNDRMQILLTLLVACFSQLDVVIQAPMLDTLEETREIKDLESQTQAFLGSVVQSILPVIAKAQMRLVTGLFGLLLDRNDIVAIARTRPGIALLTLFLSRAEVILQNVANGSEVDEAPTPDELQSWNMLYNHLFELLRPHLPLLFPSVRLSMLSGVNFTSIPNSDVIDQPVWQFFASLACSANDTQQQVLVGGLRDVVLENVTTATKGMGLESEERRRLRLANVNLFLHALGLDSSQIVI
ncbi:hypothetical protein BN946_scf185008.g68 [Trametes cinnabarina]|uniref:mRNA decay factor PAT1 domain-containing protein n=1 Tax=Pycnoporus cinnabarinus TaxID=5643 RepID=A0A060SGL8_PYCCI|nr:hypothetical protein BN946_scf185008.g68 [Trametes cinnabarina]